MTGDNDQTHKLQLTSARDQVAAYIRKNIYNGKFEPKMVIRQEKLSADLGVSRTPIREAIQQLCNEGILSQEPHRGAVVRKLTDREMRERTYVFVLLQGEVVHLALLNGIPRKRFEDLKEKLAQAHHDHDTRILSQCDTELHELLFEACGNRELNQLCIKYSAKGLKHGEPDHSVDLAFADWLYGKQCRFIDEVLSGNEDMCRQLISEIETEATESWIRRRNSQ